MSEKNADDIALENLHSQLIKLGDLMGDGEHHEPGNGWISRDYKRVFKEIEKIERKKNPNDPYFKQMDEINKQRKAFASKKRKAKWDHLQPQIEQLLTDKKSVCCDEPLNQQRKNCLIIVCTKCSKRYKLKTKKVKA